MDAKAIVDNPTSSQLAPRQLVVVQNLVSSPQFNGQVATIVKFLESQQRYKVKLRGISISTIDDTATASSAKYVVRNEWRNVCLFLAALFLFFVLDTILHREVVG